MNGIHIPGSNPEKKLEPPKNTVDFPLLKGMKERLEAGMSDIPKKLHRYIGMVVSFEHSAIVCQAMEAEDIEVFAVNAFVQPMSPTQMAMSAFVMGRVDKERPPTKMELDAEADAKRLIQPAVNRPNFGQNGRHK
jgi:hypothetical protein